MKSKLKLLPRLGFSLVEMSIVLVIVALLLGSLLPKLSSQVNQQRRTETQKYMREVSDALLGYAVTNGRLPCPDTNNDGTAETVCILAASAVGALPYNDLSVTSKDAYGKALLYAVTPAFAAATPFTLANTGSVKICSVAAASTATACTANLSSAAVAAIISRGEIAAHSPTIDDETENTDGDADFVSHDLVQNGYDDLVVWLSPNTLFNRMVAAGKLP
jgi:prepilin-type N-terminal cleavage/methylation domain-containing protein